MEVQYKKKLKIIFNYVDHSTMIQYVKSDFYLVFGCLVVRDNNFNKPQNFEMEIIIGVTFFLSVDKH